MTNIDEDCTQIAKNFKPLNNHKLLYEEGYKAGKKDKEKEMFDIIEEELKIDEDMPILKKHIEQIRNRIKQKLKGASNE